MFIPVWLIVAVLVVLVVADLPVLIDEMLFLAKELLFWGFVFFIPIMVVLGACGVGWK
jgi:hypothetical protein